MSLLSKRFLPSPFLRSFSTSSSAQPSVFGSFAVHKTRAAMAFGFERATVTARTSQLNNNTYYALKAPGSLRIEFAAAEGASTAPGSVSVSEFRKYLWNAKVVVKMSVSEMGEILAFGSLQQPGEMKIYHDPAKGAEDEGAVRKELVIKRVGIGKGFYFNLAMTRKGEEKTVIQCPVSDGEFQVLATIFKNAIPQLLCMNQLNPVVEVPKTVLPSSEVSI